MKNLTPPATYDPWVTIQWLLEHQQDLWVKVIRPKEKPSDPTVADLVRLPDLTPASWIFHARRLHFDSTHQVWTQAHWKRWEEEQLTPLADF